MLFFGSQVIAVILAVFLHHGNGREESANKGSDSVILPMEGNPVWRHKRSLPDEPDCYTGNYLTVFTKDHGYVTYPKCKTVALTACSSEIAKHGMRKCVGSNFVAYSVHNVTRVYPKTCSCAE